jgi:hypothetical protein
MGYDARTTWGTKKKIRNEIKQQPFGGAHSASTYAIFSSWSALRAGRTSKQKGVDTEANARRG